jgi:signal transduction histidine kinase
VDVRFGLHGNHAVLEVEDNGPGVDEKDRKAIFGRFFRSGDEMTRSSQGTGLGLYLVQQIVEAHRGSVKVAETGPEGSIFRVTVPAYER